MTETPASAVGADAAVGADKIDAYLDSVERVLLAAHAPSRERLQVLQDLESQIADMLAQHPLPFTEETVQSVIAALEPPDHFAAIYGTETATSQPSVTAHSATVPYNPWLVVAATSCALIPLSCLLLMLLANVHAHGPADIVLVLLLIGSVVTPIAFWKGFQQLRAEPTRYRGHELAISTLVAYCTTIPLLLLVLVCIATQGYILFPIAIASFLYFQWVLIRRLQRRLAAAIPTQPPTGSFRDRLWRFTPPAQATPC